MTKFEAIKGIADNLEEIAVYFDKLGETDLSKFYKNASIGFNERLNKLSFEEAEQCL